MCFSKNNLSFLYLCLIPISYFHYTKIKKEKNITSNKDDSFFNGKANKIIIFNDEKVHLIGDATMFYENINISSDKIVFNPQTGSLLSEK